MENYKITVRRIEIVEYDLNPNFYDQTNPIDMMEYDKKSVGDLSSGLLSKQINGTVKEYEVRWELIKD